MCTHSPECPPVDKPGWDTAALLVHHAELGWSMLCNGAIVMDAAVRAAPAPAVIEMRARRRAVPARELTGPLAA